MSDQKSVGQPSKYRPEFPEMLFQHMKEGLSYEAFAAVAGVSRKTLYNWEEQFPEFAEAKEIGIEASLLFWEKMGRDHILNVSESMANVGSKSQSLNATIWIFNMKNRFKWRDKQADEADVVVNNVTNISDEELDSKIQKLTGGKSEN